MSIDWDKAPTDATDYFPGNYQYAAHWVKKGFYCIEGFESGGWREDRSPLSASKFYARPTPQPKPWSGPEDGLPPVGLEVEIKIDFKRAPPYAIITLTELSVDVQNHTPRFQKVKVLYASSKYLVAESCGAECLTPMSCVEIRAIRTPEQLASDKRETAIRELMDIAQVDCRVTAARLVDAGFKREVV